MSDGGVKACSKCRELKPVAMFSRRGDGSGKPRSECKACDVRRVQSKYVRSSRCAMSDDERIQRRRARQREYERKHRDEAKRRLLEWRAKQGREKLAEDARRRASERAKKLTDGYLRTLLHYALEVSRADVGQELLELKREQIEIYRMSRQLKKAANESSTNPD